MTNMEPKKGLLTRYLNKVEKETDSIIQPKEISRKRVFNRAHMLHEGNGASPYLSFSDALKKAWEVEINMIKNGGFIYNPYYPLSI